MTANKTVQNNDDAKQFIEQVKDDTKREDCLALIALMQQLTGEAPAMWGTSIVGFGSYHYQYKSGRQGDFLRVGFSPRAQNISIYIMPGFDKFESELKVLGKHKLGKSCLYVKRLSDIDFEVLKKIVGRSVEIMAELYPDT